MLRWKLLVRLARRFFCFFLVWNSRTWKIGEKKLMLESKKKYQEEVHAKFTWLSSQIWRIVKMSNGELLLNSIKCPATNSQMSIKAKKVFACTEEDLSNLLVAKFKAFWKHLCIGMVFPTQYNWSDFDAQKFLFFFFSIFWKGHLKKPSVRRYFLCLCVRRVSWIS